MTKLEKILYTAKAHTTGGRDDGASRTDDGRLQVTLSRPGTPGSGTNPERILSRLVSLFSFGDQTDRWQKEDSAASGSGR